MNLIRNKGFRIFLYILGYVSCAAIIALSVITMLRYTVFQSDLDSAGSYAETSYIKSIVYNNGLLELQKKAGYDAQWEAAGLEESAVDLFDYRNGGRERVPLKAFTDTYGLASVRAGLIESSYNWNEEQTIGEDLVIRIDYTEAGEDASGSFLKIRTDDYLRLIKNNARIFSSGYMEIIMNMRNGKRYPNEDAQEDYSLYSAIIENNYASYLMDGDYFLLLDDGIFIYSPGYFQVQILRNNNFYSYSLSDEGSALLYVSLPEDLAAKKSITEDSDASAASILSGSVYRSPFDAFYSGLKEEQRTLIRNQRELSSPGGYIYANTAYSLGKDKVSGLNICDTRLLSYTAGSTGFSESFSELAGEIEKNADIYIRYDREDGKLTQWYKDPSGSAHEFRYVDRVENLTDLADDSFVLGLNVYESFSNTLVLESLMFGICRAIPSPVLWLVLAAVVFLLCVILLLWGVPAKLLAVDAVPFEIFALGWLIIVFLTCWVIPHEVGRNVFTLMKTDPKSAAAVVLLGILVLYLVTAALFTTIARRIKCKAFTKGLLTVKLAKWIGLGILFLCRKTANGWRRLADTYRKALCGNKRLIVFGTVLFAVNTLVLFFYGASFGSFGAAFILAAAEAFAGYHLLNYSAGVEKVLAVSRRMEGGEPDAKADLQQLKYNVREMGESLNHIGDGFARAVETSVREERTRAELITNVSHDIKTPLTSIISYVDLLKREPAGSEKAKEYLDILDKKSQTLKNLIQDLIEVSKTSTGNIELDWADLDLVQLLQQSLGEYEERFAACGLETVLDIRAEKAMVRGDGRRMFRIMDNLLKNVEKYAQSGTRVYITLAPTEKSTVTLSLKNVSREMLNISAEELTERFVRGDRSRHTEGSGLGLSIAKNLAELQGGSLQVQIDGDLFKAELEFPLV